MSTYEALPGWGNWAPREGAVIALPDTQGDTTRTYWQEGLQARSVVERALEGEFEQSVEIHLPEVVGHIPEEEQAEFDASPSSYDYETDKPGNSKLPKGFREIIERDLVALGVAKVFEKPEDFTLRVENTFVEAGQMPGRSLRSDWHVDHTVAGRADGGMTEVMPIGYVVANRYPTWFFSGRTVMKAKDFFPGIVRAEIDVEGLDVDNNTVAQPEPYAVVRLGPLCLHSRPIVPEDVQRTFMRVSLYPTSKGEKDYIERLGVISRE